MPTPDDKHPRYDDVDDDVRAAMAELEKAATDKETASEPVKDASDDVAAQPDKPVADASPDKADGKGRERGADGRFVSRDGDKPATDAAGAAPKDGSVGQPKAPEPKPAEQPAAGQPGPDVQAAAVAGNPPPGWSIAAKTAWSKLPQEVRDAVAKREQEVNNGFARLQDYKGLDTYVDMAKQGGKVLSDVVKNYVEFENLCHKNPAQGMVNIASAIGLSRQDAAAVFLRLAQDLGADISMPAHQNGQHKNGNGAHQNGGLSPDLHAQLAPVLNPVLQQVQELRNTLTSRDRADQERRIQDAGAVYASMLQDPKFPYLANLEPVISDLLEKGLVRRTGDYRKDIEAAYEHAMWTNPEIRSALIKQQHEADEVARVAREKEAAAKALAASRSVSGSAAPGMAEKITPRHGEDDLTADVRAAIAQVQGRV